MIYPDEGELFKSTVSKPNSSGKLKPLVFFVHFLKGHKKALKRHIQLVNELGYDAYAFNLQDSWKKHQYLPYSHESKKFGLKHALADQIETHLNLLPEFPEKIIFSFSNISASAMEAMARRFEKKQNDIVAMICDSGPGVDFFQSAYNLVKYQFEENSILMRLIKTPLIAYGWSKSLNKDVHYDLQKFPEGFPILSIRGWRDRLVPPESIDKIFEPHSNLKWRKLNLPEASHVNGLRDFPSEYIPEVQTFLKDLI